MLFCASIVAGQEDTKTDDDPELVKLRAVLDRSVDGFQVFPSRDTSAKMTSKSVLRWTNNERDSQSVGVVMLWIDGVRPAAVMATYNWMGNIFHEFDVLSRSPVIARQDGALVWQPKAGLEFQPVPGAAAVEMNSGARLRQMKEISEQFEATMLGWRADNSDRAELRRLPHQLYRYQSESSDVIDGAIFAFVMGNDPEAMLLIEAVKRNNQTEWQYAFVRQTSGGLEGRYKNRIVWTVDKHGQRRDPTASGISLMSRLNLKAELGK
jgi:hypothetical protein